MGGSDSPDPVVIPEAIVYRGVPRGKYRHGRATENAFVLDEGDCGLSVFLASEVTPAGVRDYCCQPPRNPAHYGVAMATIANILLVDELVTMRAPIKEIPGHMEIRETIQRTELFDLDIRMELANIFREWALRPSQLAAGNP
jgi:hypothetical protein